MIHNSADEGNFCKALPSACEEGTDEKRGERIGEGGRYSPNSLPVNFGESRDLLYSIY